jgi:putative tryptophan/tyrosine transport system substrate-binding protein
MMRRREFITLLGGAAAPAAWPLAARAQQSAKVPRIGILSPGRSEGPDATFETSLNSFLQGLRELGYTEGQNIVIERRYGEWKLDRLPDLAAELVRLQVDVIVAVSTPSARAAKQATSTIPIVAAGMADPVGDEFVTSLARPGGNVTGTTFLGPELIAKRLGLLKETIPGVSRVAALWHPRVYGEHTMEGIVKDTQIAAGALGVRLQLVQALGPNDFDSAFSAMTEERAGAVIVLPSPMLFGEHRRIVDLAAKSRLPAMYAAREFVDAGGLMSYGANLADLFRRSATYVDKILKGAKPSDLPVEQPTKFEFVINLKTAKALGLEIHPMLLARADEVIE